MEPKKWFTDKGQILALVISALSLVAAAKSAWPDLMANRFVGSGALLFYALVILEVVLVIYWIRETRAVRGRLDDGSTSDEPSAHIAPAILASFAVQLVDVYRRLAHDFPDAARYPLAEHSWPAFGHSWQYVHIELDSLRARLNMLISISKIAYRTGGWNPTPLLLSSASETTHIATLISYLESFIESARAIARRE